MKKPKPASGSGRNIRRRKIASGIWEDIEGNAHYDCAELAQLFHVPMSEVLEIVRVVLERECPHVKHIIRTDAETPDRQN